MTARVKHGETPMKNARSCYAALAVAAFAVAVPGAAQAGLRDDVMTAAQRCWSLSDDKAWLACYYRAAQPMQAAVNPMAPPVKAQAAPLPRVVAAPPRRSRSWLGRMFNDDTARAPAPVTAPPPGMAPVPTDHITARLASYSFSQTGVMTVTLDNGEVWRQVDGDGPPPRLKNAARSYVVTIRPGFIGSYSMTVSGQTGLYKVRRLN